MSIWTPELMLPTDFSRQEKRRSRRPRAERYYSPVHRQLLLLGAGAGGGAAEVPQTISGLVGFWHGDQGRFQSEAGTITASAHRDPVRYLRDLSGQNNHLTVDSDQAYVETRIFDDGGSCIYFDGLATDGLTASSLAIPRDDHTIVLYLLPLSYRNGGNSMGHLWGAPNYAFAMGPTTNYDYPPVYGLYNAQSEVSLSAGLEYDPTEVTTIIVRVTSSGYSVRLNGTDHTSGATPDSGADLTGFSLGGTLAGATWSPGKFYLLGAAVYSRGDLTTEDCEALEAYRDTRYSTPARMFSESDPLLIIDGNSIPAWSKYPPDTAAYLSGDANWIDLSIAGRTSPQLLADFSDRAAPFVEAGRDINAVIYHEFTNDLYYNREDPGGTGETEDAATAYANSEAIRSAYETAGATHFATVTCLPNVNLTDESLEARRVAVNDLVKADRTIPTDFPRITAATSALVDVCIDWGTDPDMGQPGDEADTTYYSDGAHITTDGVAVGVDNYFAPLLGLWGIGPEQEPPGDPFELDGGLETFLDFSQPYVFQDSSRTVAVTTTGDRIGGVTDRSGNGNHYVQADNDKRFTWNSGSGGYGYGDGSNDELVGPGYTDFAKETGAELFIVIRHPGTGSGAHCYFSSASGGYYPFGSDIYEDFARPQGRTNWTPSSWDFTTRAIYNVRGDDSAWAAELNGAASASDAGNWSSGTFSANSKIGTNAAAWGTCEFSMVVLCNRVLTSDERQRVLDYLSAKYSISLA